MSLHEDTRKVLQDVIVPDLKASSVRLDSVEKVMHLRFDHLNERFGQMKKRTDNRFTQMERRMDDRLGHMEKRIELHEDFVSAQFDQLLTHVELLTAIVKANHDSAMTAVTRRPDKIESTIALGEERLSRNS